MPDLIRHPLASLRSPQVGKVEFYARDLARKTVSQPLPVGKVHHLKLDLAQVGSFLEASKAFWPEILKTTLYYLPD